MNLTANFNISISRFEYFCQSYYKDMVKLGVYMTILYKM